MTSQDEIETWIVDWFEENGTVSRDVIEERLGDDYLDEQWIDSLEFTNLVLEVENEYDVEFSNDEFQDRSFATVNGLAEIINHKVNSSS